MKLQLCQTNHNIQIFKWQLTKALILEHAIRRREKKKENKKTWSIYKLLVHITVITNCIHTTFS